MSRNYLFQNNKKPFNHEIIGNSSNTKFLVSTKFNSEAYQIIHLLIGSSTNSSSRTQYQLYNWNITSNLLQLIYENSDWNCKSKCQISATSTFFLLEDYQYSYLYTFNSSYFIDQLQNSIKKNRVPILNQTNHIRKKSDINKQNYVFASGNSLLTISYTNKTAITNVFSIPLIYNFNPNNFVLDTRLYSNKLFILYRSISTYNIYLYEFQQAQLLFQQYPNNTKLNSTGISIREVFRFNNNYITKVIKFARGADDVTGNLIIWAYNENEAYKCVNIPCLGFGYEIYSNIVFSAVASTNRTIAFYGKSNLLDLKNFKPNLFSEQIDKYYFSLNISLAEMISSSNYTVTKIIVAAPGGLFPTVYKVVNDCTTVQAFEEDNFCRCHVPSFYSPMLGICTLAQQGYAQSNLDTVYIAFIAIFSIFLFTLFFMFYRKIMSFRRIRKSWQYNAAQNIIFQ